MRQKKWGFFNTKYLIRANPNKCKKWSTIRSLNHFWSTISPILFRLSTKSLYVKITSILWIRTTKTQNNQQFIMSTQVRESRFFEKKINFFVKLKFPPFIQTLNKIKTQTMTILIPTMNLTPLIPTTATTSILILLPKKTTTTLTSQKMKKFWTFQHATQNNRQN